VNDYENARLIKQSGRRIGRQHLWRRPWESTVAGIFGNDALERMALSSIGHPVPLPILNMMQAQIYDGMLIPVIGGGGFSGLGDALSEFAGGKGQQINFYKVGVTGAAGFPNTLWYEGKVPVGGATMDALPGGTECSRTTQGALGQFNPATGGDTQHLLGAYCAASAAGNSLLLYDRIFGAEIAASTSGDQTVTISGGLNRYAGTGANATSAGNFAMVEIRTALGATAHTWTLTYKDDQNNTAEAATALTGVSSGIAKRIDTTLRYWGIPLNTGDLGVSDVTIIANSASVTGATCLVVGHAIGFLPIAAVVNYNFSIDYVNQQFAPARIYDDACLAFLELAKPSATATTYWGQIITGAG